MKDLKLPGSHTVNLKKKTGFRSLRETERNLASAQDTIPAMLRPGEFVLPPETVDQMGVDNLNQAVMDTTGEMPTPGGELREDGRRGFYGGGIAADDDLRRRGGPARTPRGEPLGRAGGTSSLASPARGPQTPIMQAQPTVDAATGRYSGPASPNPGPASTVTPTATTPTATTPTATTPTATTPTATTPTATTPAQASLLRRTAGAAVRGVPAVAGAAMALDGAEGMTSAAQGELRRSVEDARSQNRFVEGDTGISQGTVFSRGERAELSPMAAARIRAGSTQSLDSLDTEALMGSEFAQPFRRSLRNQEANALPEAQQFTQPLRTEKLSPPESGLENLDLSGAPDGSRIIGGGGTANSLRRSVEPGIGLNTDLENVPLLSGPARTEDERLMDGANVNARVQRSLDFFANERRQGAANREASRLRGIQNSEMQRINKAREDLQRKQHNLMSDLTLRRDPNPNHIAATQAALQAVNSQLQGLDASSSQLLQPQQITPSTEQGNAAERIARAQNQGLRRDSGDLTPAQQLARERLENTQAQQSASAQRQQQQDQAKFMESARSTLRSDLGAKLPGDDNQAKRAAVETFFDDFSVAVRDAFIDEKDPGGLSNRVIDTYNALEKLSKQRTGLFSTNPLREATRQPPTEGLLGPDTGKLVPAERSFNAIITQGWSTLRTKDKIQAADGTILDISSLSTNEREALEKFLGAAGAIDKQTQQQQQLRGN